MAARIDPDRALQRGQPARSGAQVFADTTIAARGRTSDVTLEFPANTVFEFAADHRITRIQIGLDATNTSAASG